MAEITNLADRKPHIGGEAKCLGCGHEWHAVAPVGTTRLECPVCSLEKGVIKYLAEPEAYFECGCGNSLFYIVPDGNMCAKCGTTKQF